MDTHSLLFNLTNQAPLGALSANSIMMKTLPPAHFAQRKSIHCVRNPFQRRELSKP